MPQQINFYKSEFRIRRKEFASATLLQGTAIIAFTMFLAFMFASQKVTRIELELDAVSKQEIAATARLERLQPVIAAVSNGKSWQQRLDEANRLLDEKQLVLSLVQGKSFGDTKGFSRHLRSLARLNIDGIWLTAIRLSALGDSTRLEGRAIRPGLIPAYLQYLAEEPPFATQRFHQFQIDIIEGQSGDNVSFSVMSDAEFIAHTVARQ